MSSTAVEECAVSSAHKVVSHNPVSDGEVEFRELTDRVEDDIRTLRNNPGGHLVLAISLCLTVILGGAGRRNLVMRQIEHDLTEAESQARSSSLSRP
jgi:hypothetical protein